MALQVVDRAIQAFGAEGVSQDQFLAESWAGLRTLRLADVGVSYHCFVSWSFILRGSVQGPDEVHIQQIGQRELKRAVGLVRKAQEVKKREDALLAKHDIKASL